MASVKKGDIEVSKEDQSNINNFSKLNQRFHEKNNELLARDTILEELDDASTELELIDDEGDLRLKFGECFIRVDVDTCKDYVEKLQESTKAERAELKTTVEDLVKKMNKLKSSLYGKFGNSIQLEED